MKGKKSFTAYCDWIETFEALDDEQAGKLVKHLFRYVNDLDPEPPNMLINAVFASIKSTLKRDLAKWLEVVEDKSTAGLKSAGLKAFRKDLDDKIKKGIDKISKSEHDFERGRCLKYMAENHGTHWFYFYEAWANWHQQKSTELTGVDFNQQTLTKSTVRDSVRDSDKEVKKESVKKSRFAPPSLLEVENYIYEKGYLVNAQNFLNYYESKGWMIGKNKMKDWKAAVRTWHSREKEKSSAKKEKPNGLDILREINKANGI